jgi:hypothetical protein
MPECSKRCFGPKAAVSQSQSEVQLWPEQPTLINAIDRSERRRYWQIRTSRPGDLREFPENPGVTLGEFPEPVQCDLPCPAPSEKIFLFSSDPNQV